MLEPLDRPWNTADVYCDSSPTMARCSAAKATGNPQTNFMVCACPSDSFSIDTVLRVGALFSISSEFGPRRSNTDREIKAPGEPNSQVAYGTPQVAHTASM